MESHNLEVPSESLTRNSDTYHGHSSNPPTIGSSSRDGLVRSNSQLSLSDLPPGFTSRDLLLPDGTSSDEDSSTEENVKDYDGIIIPSHGQKRSRSGDTLADSESEGEKEFVASDYRVIATHLRVIVLVLFVGLSVALPLVAYSISRKNQQELFEGSFSSISAKLIDNVEFQLSRKFSAVESLRVALTSHGSNLSNNQTWPFVTIPDWDLRGNNVRDLGGLLTITLHPKVTKDNREEWENYVQENLDWLWQAQERGARTKFTSENRLHGKRLLEKETELTITVHHGQTIMKDIFGPDDHSATGFARAKNTDAPFFPVWMHMTPSSELINFNLLSCNATGKAARHTIATGEVTISHVKDPDNNGGVACQELEEYVASLNKEYHKGDVACTYEDDPVATLSFPVFDSFDLKKQKVVAVLTSLMHFHDLFATVLSEDNGGIVAVLSNTCGEIFSYVINRDCVLFLGPGDHHDVSFDSQEQSFNFSDWSSSKDFSQIEQSLTLSEHYCAYSLKVYPTVELYGQYITREPIKYGMTMFVVIFFISCVFLTYDRVVQRRMNKILHNAKNSRAIVTSLFPAKVRNRLLQGEADKPQRSSPCKRQNSTISRGSQSSSRRNSPQHSRRMSNEDSTKRVNYEVCGSSRRSSNEARRNSNEARSTSTGRRNSKDFMPDIFPFSTAVNGVSNVVTGVGTIAGNLLLAPSKLRLKFFLRGDNPDSSFVESYHIEEIDEDSQIEKPIADLFLHCTVLFADIAGFTGSYRRHSANLIMRLVSISVLPPCSTLNDSLEL